jgi:hypothetical protein
MNDELRARREQIEILVRVSENDLREARNSAALGGHSRALLLHLERKLQAGRRDLASLDLQLARFSVPVGASDG